MVIRIKILLNYWIGGFTLKRLLRSQIASLGGVSGGWLYLRPAFFEILSKGQPERNENHRNSHKVFFHDFNFPVRLNISERLKHPGAPFFLAVSTGRLNTRS